MKRNLKNIITILIIILLSLIISMQFTYAKSDTVVSLSDSEITVNGETIGTNTSESVYLTNKMNNGGTI